MQACKMDGVLLEIYLEKTSLDSVFAQLLIKQKEIRNLQII